LNREAARLFLTSSNVAPAEILTTVELRDKMLKIAADYERMAEAADKLKDDSADSVNLRTLR
jgi:hypothetical protein